MNLQNKLINILVVAILLAAWFLYSECTVTTTDDGVTASFTISPENPIIGNTVTLDGSASTGPINQRKWTVVSRPGEEGESTNEIANDNQEIATFIPDIVGPYTIQLKVFNVHQQDSKQLNFEAFELFADAGDEEQYWDVGETVLLDGSGSAPSESMNATWTLLSKPVISSVTSINDPTSFFPTFLMDEPGTYEIELNVKLIEDNSKYDLDTVLVIANPPQINSFNPQGGYAGTEVTISGKNYSSFPEGNIVDFNGVSAEITEASDSTLTVIAPQGITTGPITVEIEESGEEVVSAEDFIVAGTGWTTIATDLPPLWSVDFGDQLKGAAVGEDGTIMYTTDGGYTWNTATSNTTQALREVSFGTPNTAYAVGGYGTIVKTTDGGSTWDSIPTGILSAMVGVSFLDENTGFVAGSEPHVILFTGNGGATWEDRTPQTYTAFDDIFFITNDVGSVSSKYDVFNTNDGGITWSIAQSGIYADGSYHISFINPDMGWIAGTQVPSLTEGHIAHTSDGGDTYTQQPHGISATFLDIHFIDENNGIVVGYPSIILQTTDGGTTWQLQETDLENCFFEAVHLFQSNAAILVGFDININGCILLRN